MRSARYASSGDERGFGSDKTGPTFLLNRHRVMSLKPKRVLILCTGNSARSQMAEGLLRAQCGHEFEVFSAGTAPNRAVKEINLLRVFQMKRPQRMIPAPTRHTTAPITSHLSGRFPSMSHNHISDAAI
jgi:hypothetical protein